MRVLRSGGSDQEHNGGCREEHGGPPGQEEENAQAHDPEPSHRGQAGAEIALSEQTMRRLHRKIGEWRVAVGAVPEIGPQPRYSGTRMVHGADLIEPEWLERAKD